MRNPILNSANTYYIKESVFSQQTQSHTINLTVNILCTFLTSNLIFVQFACKNISSLLAKNIHTYMYI